MTCPNGSRHHSPRDNPDVPHRLLGNKEPYDDGRRLYLSSGWQSCEQLMPALRKEVN